MTVAIGCERVDREGWLPAGARRRLAFAVVAAALLGQAQLARAAETGSVALQKVAGSIVRVRADNCAGRSGPLLSNGFFYKAAPSGAVYVVTALHGVAACGQIKVEGAVSGAGGAWSWTAAVNAIVVRRLRAADLALLQVPNPGPPIPVATIGAEWAYAVGVHDDATAISEKPLQLRSVTNNRMSAVVSRGAEAMLAGTGLEGLANTDVLLYDGNLTPGSSGAPVVDGAGRLVGIVEGGLDVGRLGTGWAIPADRLAVLASTTDADLSAREARALTAVFFSHLTLDDFYPSHKVGSVAARGGWIPSDGKKTMSLGLDFTWLWEAAFGAANRQSFLAGLTWGGRGSHIEGQFLAPDGRRALEGFDESELATYGGGAVGFRFGRIKSRRQAWYSALRLTTTAGVRGGFARRSDGPDTDWSLIYAFPVDVRVTYAATARFRGGVFAAWVPENGASSSFRYRADASGADRLPHEWSHRFEAGLVLEWEVL